MPQYLKNRLAEPSTWVGLAVLATQAAAAAKTMDAAAIGASIAGLLGILLPEKK